MRIFGHFQSSDSTMLHLKTKNDLTNYYKNEGLQKTKRQGEHCAKNSLSENTLFGKYVPVTTRAESSLISWNPII